MGFFAMSTPPLTMTLRGPVSLLAAEIELLDPDRAMAVVERGALGRPVVDDVCLAIVVEEERRIDAVDFLEPHGLGPRALGIRRRDEEIAAGFHQRVDDVVDALVEVDRWREHAARDVQPVERELAGIAERVTDQLPVHEVRALVDRNAGKVRERGIDEVVLVADARDAGVGVVTRENRVVVAAGRQGLGERGIAAGVFEPVERHRRRRRDERQSANSNPKTTRNDFMAPPGIPRCGSFPQTGGLAELTRAATKCACQNGFDGRRAYTSSRHNRPGRQVSALLAAVRGARPARRMSCSACCIRTCASWRMRRLRRSGQLTLLDTTELVHEAYLRLFKAGSLEAGDSGQFMAYAARVMRSVVVDFVRRRAADRRGGDAVHVELGNRELPI